MEFGTSAVQNAVLYSSTNIFVSGRLQLSCGRSQKFWLWSRLYSIFAAFCGYKLENRSKSVKAVSFVRNEMFFFSKST